MAQSGGIIDGHAAAPTWALWIRVALQAVLIAWAYWYTRPARPA